MFDSKINTETVIEPFTAICTQLDSLCALRLCEKLAQPTSNDSKKRLLEGVNSVLQEIKEDLEAIRKISNHFIKIMGIREWKHGVRKVQQRATEFYQVKMKYFSVINREMKLQLTLIQLDQKDWARNCVSIVSPFCLCG